MLINAGNQQVFETAAVVCFNWYSFSIKIFCPLDRKYHCGAAPLVAIGDLFPLFVLYNSPSPRLWVYSQKVAVHFFNISQTPEQLVEVHCVTWLFVLLFLSPQSFSYLGEILFSFLFSFGESIFEKKLIFYKCVFLNDFGNYTFDMGLFL